MRNPNDILINLRKHSNESTYQYLRLYRNLFNEQMFYAAYQRIYAKPGNMTSSTDGRTLMQFNMKILPLFILMKNLRQLTFLLFMQ